MLQYLSGHVKVLARVADRSTNKRRAGENTVAATKRQSWRKKSVYHAAMPLYRQGALEVIGR